MRAVEAAALWAHAPLFLGRKGPRGPEKGAPALVLPGFLSGDHTTLQLRRRLAARGWRAHPWEGGINRGAHSGLMAQLCARLDAIADGRKVMLVGWSLGGVYARELARIAPLQVRAVVTLGSPFSGHPRLNNVWQLYERIAGHAVDAPPVPQSADKPPVPTLALWSRRDGIVAPRAARGLPHESDHAAELTCRHMEFGVSRRALDGVMREIEDFVGAP